MKTHPALSGLLGAVLCATATANNFSVSGPGGAIPDCPNAPGTWNAQPTWAVLTSNVNVANAVTSITAVRIQGLTHSYRGDIQAFLTDPAGVRYNVIVRPGFTGANSGDPGNYTLGDYVFVESGGGTIAQGGTNINGGTYNQYLNAGAGQWTSGTYVINNTLLSAITGPAGTWSVTFVDWWAADTGSITGWTLEGTDTAGFTTFCEPGVGGIIACPCGNAPSGPNRGCDNFGAASGGASFVGTGTPSLSADTVSLSVSGENNTAFTVFFQGKDPVSPTGVSHGAGVRCVTATLKRLYNGNAAAGAIVRPGMGDPSVSARSAALGDPIGPGEARHYFTIYRDPSAAGPCGNTASTVNLSSAGSCVWTP